MIEVEEKTLMQTLEEFGVSRAPSPIVVAQQKSISNLNLLPVAIAVLVIIGLATAIFLSIRTDSGSTRELIVAACLIIMLGGFRLGDVLSGE